MKALCSLVLLFVTFSVWAGMSKLPDPTIRSNKDVNYTCASYTSNTVDPKTKDFTDNDPVNRKNKVIQTDRGFIIKSGEAFKQQRILGNDTSGPTFGMAGNTNTLLIKQEHDASNVYFVIYLFDDSKEVNQIGPYKPGPKTGLITYAGCTAD